MIILKKLIANGEARQWLHVSNPSKMECETLIKDYQLEEELLQDALDPDELSRFERLDNGNLLILRIPTCHFFEDKPPVYNTTTLAIFILTTDIITVCKDKSNIIEKDNYRGYKIDDNNDLTFLLSILIRTNVEYLRLLKAIKRRIDIMENDMLFAVSNNQIQELLSVDKALQYFTTALRSNELLLAKLKKFGIWDWTEKELDLLEDVEIENKEALEVATIYSKILQSLTSAFAIVINNNLNHMMKRLTALTFLLMIPSTIGSIYGMNIKLPFMYNPNLFFIIIPSTIIFTVLIFIIFRRKRFF